MFKTKVKIFTSLIILSALVTTPIVVTSCSSSNNNENNLQENKPTISKEQELTNEIINTNKRFLDQQNNFLDNNGYILLNFDNNQTNQSIEDILVNQLDALVKNANEAINKLAEIKKNNFSSLNTNQLVWLDSYIFKWQNIISNLESGSLFLGSNPIDGAQILSSSSNFISDLIKSALNIYKIDAETGDPGTEIDLDLVSSFNQRVLDCVQTINTYIKILKIGANYGIMPSSIAKKMFINQMLTTFYLPNLENFVNSNDTSIEINKLINNLAYGFNSYFGEIYNKLNSLNISNLDLTNIKKLEDTLISFMEYYCGDYYNNPKSFGPKINSNLVLSKQSNNEVERTIVVKNKNNEDISIYGVGLTNNDLNTTNVGIGFMNIDITNSKLSNFIKQNGNDIYQQLLNNNNSINKSAIDIYQQGIKLTNDGIQNMNKVAKLVSPIIKNTNFNGQIYYDPDGLGPMNASLTNISGNSEFEKFNNWLNQEDFFFGREHLENNELNNYINQYWTNPFNNELTNYKNIIIKQGYESHWLNQKTINGLNEGTISGNQALAGSVLSLEAYKDFQKATNTLYDNAFNPYKDYVISPYNYNVRDFIGVGMEGPRGSCQFQYNCDPYYSIQKWSLSSLTVHEGKMGHHTQQEYWTEYLDKNGPGYVFKNDAFHEGWAVFAEWFANQLNTYGYNLDSSNMPTDWLNANGLVPKYDNSKLDELTSEMKKLHGGVYYTNALGNDGSEQKIMNSIKLANMLQYYGFLNEAQLRNMRLCVDVAYHHKVDTTDTSINNDQLPLGASIKQVREYMKKNSALGLGDIQSESIRYLVMPSQATGYMLGKMVFEDLYLQVQDLLREQKQDKNYLLSKDNKETKKLFDLMLRNGEIPLEVLTQLITNEYQLKK